MKRKTKPSNENSLRDRYLFLALLTGLLILLRQILFLPVVYKTPPALRLPVSADAESRLAFGAKLKLAESDIFSLELIPGVSDKLAGDLIEKQTAIMARALWSAPERRHSALELVHGIGPKTALELAQSLDLMPGKPGVAGAQYMALPQTQFPPAAPSSGAPPSPTPRPESKHWKKGPG